MLNIEVSNDGKPVFYDINEIKEKSQDIGVTELTGSTSIILDDVDKSSIIEPSNPQYGDSMDDGIQKFDRLKDEPNYYKLLIDFKAYDSKGAIAPQQAVRISGQDSFPEDFSEILGNALQEHESEQSL